MIKKNKLLKEYQIIIEEIKTVDLKYLSNADMLDMSNKLKEGALKGINLNELIIYGFALVKEAIKRTLEFEVYDVQLLAAIALNDKKLIEMQTGEGKTLTAVFPAYLNSLLKKGVHILTFNDYLSCRDAIWMKPIYEMLGVTVGFIQENMNREEKKKAYSCDITYVTAKESGFDYLRDSLCYDKKELIHRQLYFAIVDEADSILIDEAKIPLVIASSIEKKENNLKMVKDAIKLLEPTVDYKTDEYCQNIYLTEDGIKHVESILCCENIYAEKNLDLLTQVNSALYAEVLLKKDIDYIVKNEKIEMVDEFTGRIAENRHWPDGLQGALEAKEDLKVNTKGKIMTQITLQHFIKLYENLAGMTGTASDSKNEFLEFYGIDVVVIPSNRPCIRRDLDPYIFTHKEEKNKAIIEEIKKVHLTGQPILIGTSNIKESFYIANQLLKIGVKCQVLNAKNDELEAHIIQNAGRLGAVTVSTNMAGRGTDILLGGINGEYIQKIKELGGLYVIGTNRHESLRIDKQLMGRAGRQGNPGMTRFFISLEDDLMLKYGIDSIIPKRLQPKKQNEPLYNSVYKKKIDQVQRIIQGQNSDLRRELYKYSDILNSQRQYVYNLRMKILSNNFLFNLEEILPKVYEKFKKKYDEEEIIKSMKNLNLFYIDQCWADYLEDISNLKSGIHLQVIAGKNPLREFEMSLIDSFKILQQQIEERIKNEYIKIDISDVTLEEINERCKPMVSTWTYIVTDNSFAENLGIMLLGMGGMAFVGGSVAALSIAIDVIINSLKKHK